MLALRVVFACLVVEARRWLPSSSGLVCSEGVSSSTCAIDAVVADQEYWPAALASMLLLRRRVTMNFRMPMIAYMPKIGGYVCFQSIFSHVL